MKWLTVVVTESYLVPDSYQVVDHPVDEIESHKIHGQHYQPAIHWLEYRVDPESSPHGVWVQNDEMSEAIGSRMDTAGHEITLVDAPHGTIPREVLQGAPLQRTEHQVLGDQEVALSNMCPWALFLRQRLAQSVVL